MPKACAGAANNGMVKKWDLSHRKTPLHTQRRRRSARQTPKATSREAALFVSNLPDSSNTSSRVQPASVADKRGDRSDEPFPDYYDDLTGSLQHAWQLIGRATKDRKSDFHAPILSTVSADGPEARVLILRAFDVDTRTLTFHTDTRSAKVPALTLDARVAVTFYDTARKLQLRTKGEATLHVSDALANARWQASSASSLRCYLGRAPGATSEQPTTGLPADIQGVIPGRAELATGQANFMVLQIKLQRLEWLYLHSRGQRRALYSWNADGLKMDWLNP